MSGSAPTKKLDHIASGTICGSMTHDADAEQATSTLTDELLEAAVLNASATAAGGTIPAKKQKFSSI